MKKILLLLTVVLLASCGKDSMDEPAPRPQVVSPPVTQTPTGLTEAQIIAQSFQLKDTYVGRVSTLEYATFTTPDEASRNAELAFSINGYDANLTTQTGTYACTGDNAGGWTLTGFINVPNTLELEAFRDHENFRDSRTVTVTTDTGTETQQVTYYLEPTLENVLAAFPSLSAGDFEIDNPETEDWNDIHIDASFTSSYGGFGFGASLLAADTADVNSNKSLVARLAYGNLTPEGNTPHGAAVWTDNSVSINYSGTLYPVESGDTAIGIVQASGSCPSSSKASSYHSDGWKLKQIL